jgi:hypothetical protein
MRTESSRTIGLDFDSDTTIEQVHRITEEIRGRELLCGVPRHHTSI